MAWVDARKILFSVVILIPGLGSLSVAHAAVTISTKQSQNITCINNVCKPTAANAVLNITDLTNMLASGNVNVNTGSDQLAKQVQDIVVYAPFSWASASALTLDAYHSIVFNRAVSAAGSGTVALITNDGGHGGVLLFNPRGSLSFLDTTNSVTINHNVYTLAGSIATLAADIGANPSGNYALTASYNAETDGVYAAAPVATTFAGSFNGLGNAITHLKVAGAAESLNLGLFAEVGATGTISSIRISAYIRAKPNSYAGVLAGVNFGTVFNSFVRGSIVDAAGNVGGTVGGLVGQNGGTLNQTGAATKTEIRGNGPLTSAYVGGLAGQNVGTGTIKASYASGPAAAAISQGSAVSGGLVGSNTAAIENCYATGATSIGASLGVGGLVGYNGLTISNSYSTGAPTAAGGYVGGSIGVDASGGGISNDYWDTSTSGIANPSQGAGNPPNDPGITGETTTQLQSGLPAGFDPTIWAESQTVNGGLPYLIANPPQ